MTRTHIPNRRRFQRPLAVAGALAAVMAVAPTASAAPEPITIPLESGALTVNGFTMNWPARSETGAQLVGTWDAETGALDAELESDPVTLTFPQLDGGEGTVSVNSATFLGTVLPGEEGDVIGTISVDVVGESESVAVPCSSEGEITFTSSLTPVGGGFDMTLSATGFDFPLDSGYLDVTGASETCTEALIEVLTGTPTVSTELTITGFVAEAPPEPEPTTTVPVTTPEVLPTTGNDGGSTTALIAALFLVVGAGATITARVRRHPQRH